MSLKWPIVFALLVVPLLYIAIRKLRKPKQTPLFVAETESIKQLPSYKKITHRAKMLNIIESISLLLLLLALLFVSARPQQPITTYSEEKSRDIVLCLDVSGSMQKFIAPALDVMEQIYKQNPSDRYGMVAFASRGYAVLPLTRDAAAIQQKIDLLRSIYGGNEINDPDYAFRSLAGFGTDIGEGILTCINRFTNLDNYKSRTIILLSDLVQTGGDFDPDSKRYLERVGLLPKYRINFYVMRAVGGEDASYANNEIVDIGGGRAYDVNDANNQEATKEVANRIFAQALNSEQVSSKNLSDNPSVSLLVCGILLITWVLVVAIRNRSNT